MSGRGRRRRMRISLLLLASIAVAAAGCGGDDTQVEGVEKTTIKVGMLPLPEVAPIQIGIDKGYFAEEGITVEWELIQGGGAALPDLLTGKLDVLHSNYVSIIKASAAGAAKLKVLGEAYVAEKGNFVLMTKKGSSIEALTDLKGKKVGVNTLDNVATLSVSALVKTAGLTAGPPPADVQFVERPFPQMAGALSSGQVDAAFMPEPFWQAAEAKDARVLSELFIGSTAKFPIAGYVITEQFAKDNPQTVASFQRGLHKAVNTALADSVAAKAAILKYTKIPKSSTDLMQLGGYSASVHATRLQRVADLMAEFGLLQRKFDVTPLLLSASPS